MQSNATYTFTQEPVSVKTRRKKNKYRDYFDDEPPTRFKMGNLMNDPRIIRGNTYAQQVLRLTEEEREILSKKKKSKKRPKLQKTLEKTTFVEKEEEDNDEVPPLEGRKHISQQTESFLEEITDREIEKDVDTQTDPFVDRPASPQFIKSKIGVEKSTQVDGELFNFDFEVEPLLQVIIGKTLEQSVLEVMKEEELKALEEQKRGFEQKRNQELAETQRLEAEERRKFEEVERRKKQEIERMKKEEEMKKILSARQFSKDFLRNIETKVMYNLEKKGYFFDKVEKTVRTEFIPWLVKNVNEQIRIKKMANNTLDDLIKGIF